MRQLCQHCKHFICFLIKHAELLEIYLITDQIDIRMHADESEFS